MIRVEILADRRSTAEDFARLLAAEQRIEVVGIRAVGERLEPGSASDVLLAARLLSAQIPRRSYRPVVAVSDDHLDDVHASLPLHSSPEAVIAAIIAAAAGLHTLTADQLASLLPHRNNGPVVDKLTPREVEVLRLMADGFSNKEIAAHLRISGNTVKFHVAQVLAKLGASSRTEATRIGLRRGLIAL